MSGRDDTQRKELQGVLTFRGRLMGLFLTMFCVLAVGKTRYYLHAPC